MRALQSVAQAPFNQQQQAAEQPDDQGHAEDYLGCVGQFGRKNLTLGPVLEEADQEQQFDQQQAPVGEPSSPEWRPGAFRHGSSVGLPVSGQRGGGGPALSGSRRGEHAVMAWVWSFLLSVSSIVGLAAVEVRLQAPLTTVHRLAPTGFGQGERLQVDLVVPAAAPADLGVGAYRTDRDGTWFQRLHPQRLQAGRQRLVFDLGPAAALVGEPHQAGWTPVVAAESYRAGLFFWSASASRVRLQVMRVQWDAAPKREAPRPAPGLRDLALPGLQDDHIAWTTGERWQLACRPHPMPADPYDPEGFRLVLRLTDPQEKPLRFEGFYREPFVFDDAGDHEEAVPVADGHFALRWRPRRPGRYRASLQARWPDGQEVVTPLPDILVEGPVWDDYVRVDRVDPRFFATGRLTGRSRFYWSTGINLRSVSDTRSNAKLNTLRTPDRGLQAYKSYFKRFGAAGCGIAEVWMSSWNLALEWRADWPGFHGMGRYHQANAERLDRLLELAWAEGMRINLVVRNHGMGSHRTDHEWEHNPYNAALEDSRADGGSDVTPGPLAEAHLLWTDPVALAGQERLRRYLVARYADHPAIFAWKLWTEQNLTAGRAHDRLAWHRQAAERWQVLDAYGHPVTTHWSGDYRTPDRSIVALPELDFACIDAYHKNSEQPSESLADLFEDGLLGKRGGLGRFRKPILITEYGGNWNACPEPQLVAEHRAGPWISLITGYGSGPMLWWFQWVDQHDQWQPYGALARFLDGEDLRSSGRSPERLARPCHLPSESQAGPLWSRGWYRSGYLLGYLLDRRWIWNGDRSREHSAAVITIGDSVAAGDMLLEWWNADTGEPLGQRHIDHHGGRLRITAPAFTGHLAFKLKRQATGRKVGDHL